jgi:hypothetical protein
MNQEKYIGMDVHQATVSVAVMDGSAIPSGQLHPSNTPFGSQERHTPRTQPGPQSRDSSGYSKKDV